MNEAQSDRAGLDNEHMISHGVVREWDEDQGIGVIDSPATPVRGHLLARSAAAARTLRAARQAARLVPSTRAPPAASCHQGQTI
jgi:hypothetical protein